MGDTVVKQRFNTTVTGVASRVQLETRRTDLTLALGAAYRRQQQPHGPQDILDPSLHHTSSPPSPKSFQLFFFFLYCYILKIYRQRFGYTSSDTSMKGAGHA
ncbi:hypothetical protein PFLUV_G00165280 [Perca fluviatilis]|uniref:Uncharacterized protein n=1 Tax=Perca fluviatilis TaxID=8168 RepID=A0A6A5EWV6_PERFL|nr:hypothetical protein PFLUV_G00165280 [Perca fluviatilis]